MILKSVKNIAANINLLRKLNKNFPTCIFHYGVNVDQDSSLGKYNVLFNNVHIHKSIIGDHTFLQKGASVHCATIGKFCSIAPGVVVGLGRHPTDHVSSHPAFYSSTQPLAKTFSKSDIFQPFRKTKVGHDVWIGQNAMVVDGVTIGTGAVVAAGSVVTGNIEPYAIVGGIPAKTIRKRFKDSQIERLLESKWWHFSEQWLRENYAIFSDVNHFLEVVEKYSPNNKISFISRK